MAAVETKQAQFASELAHIRAALSEKDAIIHRQAAELELLRNDVLQFERAVAKRANGEAHGKLISIAVRAPLELPAAPVGTQLTLLKGGLSESATVVPGVNRPRRER
jgi:hypothetical protein